MKTLFISLLLMLALPTAHANLLSKGFELEYDVSYNTMEVGTNKRSLVFSDPTHAMFTSSAIPEGLAALILNEVVTETSKLQIDKNGVKPLHYTYKNQKKGKTEAYQINFNWQKHEFYSTHEKKNFHLPDNSQDMLSFMLYIMYALQNNKSHFTLPIADENSLRSFIVKKTGKEELELESGDFQTVIVEHFDKDKNERYTFWCAPKLDYLPVKIMKTDRKDNNIRFLLRELKK